MATALTPDIVSAVIKLSATRYSALSILAPEAKWFRLIVPEAIEPETTAALPISPDVTAPDAIWNGPI
jgi:hypothetical protein